MNLLLCLVCTMLLPLAAAGLGMIHQGLGRSRSAAHAMLATLCAVGISAILFVLIGCAWAGIAGGPAHCFVAGGKHWDWLGAAAFFPNGISAGTAGAPGFSKALTLCLGMFAAGLAAMVPLSAGTDRWRLAPICIASAGLAGFGFPLFVHWVWGGGWLAQLGLNFSLGAGFQDPAGAATVHVLGGMAALVVVWLAGPRKGKFPPGRFATAMPGHNAVYILFGCLLALAGWLAFNVAGAVLWLHAPLSALPGAAVNTLLSASGAVAATFAVTRIRFGKPDASLCANGWLAGLVASSATAGIVTPVQGLVIGLVAGVLTPLLVEVLELAVSVDDPSGAIAVHGAGGLWGLIAAGALAPQAGQLLAQLVGIAALIGIALPLVYLLLWVVNRFVPLRVEQDGERIGMDLHELGGGAYPEFVIHRDDSYR